MRPHARDLQATRRGVRAVVWKIGCFHDLRDTYLTGVKHLPIDNLKRVAGHANVRTNLKYYTSETARDAANIRAVLESSGLARPRMAVG